MALPSPCSYSSLCAKAGTAGTQPPLLFVGAATAENTGSQHTETLETPFFRSFCVREMRALDRMLQRDHSFRWKARRGRTTQRARWKATSGSHNTKTTESSRPRVFPHATQSCDCLLSVPPATVSPVSLCLHENLNPSVSLCYLALVFFFFLALIPNYERYEEPRNLAYISKWLRSSIKSYKKFDDSLEGLQTFFRDIKQQQTLEEDSDELNDFNGSREKCESFKSGNHIEKKIDSDKTTLVKINQFTTTSTCLGNDSSPGFQPQTPAVKSKTGETNEKTLKRYINNDSENKSLKHFRSQSLSPRSSPDLPMVFDKGVKNTVCDTSRVEHFPIIQDLHQLSEFPTSLSCNKTKNGLPPQNVGKLSVTPDKSASTVPSDPKLENLAVFQHFHQFPEIHPSLSCSTTTTADKIASQDTGTLTVTPKKLASLEPSDVKQDQHFVKSASSCNQKTRRLKVMQNTTYPEKQCSNLCFDEHTAQFALSNRMNMATNIYQRTEFSFQDNETAKLESFRSVNPDISFPSSNFCSEMELHVCCSSCKNPLGLPENKFLVKSLIMSSSKLFLTYIRTYGTQASFMPEHLSKTQPTVINVLSSEIMFINELIIKGHAKENFSNHGVWCKEDGCVFKTVFCPFCMDYDTCLGVHVLATDDSNVNLQNKVLFYADCLCIREPKTFDERTLTKSGNLLWKCSDHVQNGSFTCEGPFEKPAFDTKQKPAAIMNNTDTPQSFPVENEKHNLKAANKKIASSPKQNLVVHKNADNFQPKPVEIEKFAYKTATKPSNFEKFPSNAQTIIDRTEKFAYFSHPKASNSLNTTSSKLKLARRQ